MSGTGWRRGAGLVFAALALVLGAAAAVVSAQTKEEQVPWLGVMTQEITSELREGMDLTGDGVLVSRVMDGSPADRAGIEKGDVITSLNSRTVESPEELVRMIRGGRVGQSVSIGISRDGRARTVTATLAARPGEGEPGEESRRVIVRGHDEGEPGDEHRRVIVRKDKGGDEDGDIELDLPDLDHLKDLHQLGDLEHLPMVGMVGRGRLGVRVQALNPDLAEYFKVPSAGGALVLEVLKDTPAEKAGLKAGDVITKVGGKGVDGADELVRALRGEDERATLTIVRKGVTRTVETELGPAPRALRFKGDFEGWVPDGDRRIVIRRAPGADGDRRIEIRRELEGPEGDDLRRELRDLKRELEELREKLEDLRRR